MRAKLRIALIALSALIFLGSSAFLLRYAHHARAEAARAAAAVELAKQPVPLSELPLSPAPAVTEAPAEPMPEPEPTPEPVRPLEDEALSLSQLNLASLQAINPEVLGWISIPGTRIDYPLLQTDNNTHYLSFAWDGTYSNSGSIFLERRSSAAFTDYNTIIYGHNMRSGSMFAALHQYRDAEFLKAHPNVYIADGTAVRRYEIYAAYEAPVTGDTYRLIFADEAEKQRFVDLGLELSAVESGLTPDTDDLFLTLSTCTGTGLYETRWVVQAVLTGEFPVETLPAAQSEIQP